MAASSILSLSPSFNSYSSNTLADIASRVVQELRNEQNPDSSFFNWESENPPDFDCGTGAAVGEDDTEFEFSFVCRDKSSSPVSADEIFSNGKIKPFYYPVFKIGNDSNSNSSLDSNLSSNSKPRRRLPLRTLFTEERETTSCSSSEADELETIPAESYCVWTPKSTPDSSPGRCKKSNSTGSSKRWKLKEFLYRSSSDGKDTFVFLTPARKAEKKSSGDEKGKVKSVASVGGGGENLSAAARYLKTNRSMKEEEKRKSYLPYRKDILGFFGNDHGSNGNLHTF